MADTEVSVDVKNLGGRPRKYSTPEQLDEAVNNYFVFCKDKENGEPITWTGMCLFLGFYGRQELDNYQNYDGFSDCVKRAKSLVEYAYEKRLVIGDKPTGPIFALKNFGWKDTQQTELSGPNGGKIEVDSTMTPSEAYQRLLNG